MTQDDSEHQRRIRYRGTHPRQFAEKYKELQPELYGDDIAKVLARGDTPAGTHRPIMVDEVIAALRPQAGEIAVDGTIGHGGHASALLPALLPGGRLYGFDVDPIELPKCEARMRAAGFTDSQLKFRQRNFAALPSLMNEEELTGIDIFLADLGVSSMQIDNPQRGFSFKREATLDLRMNPQKGKPAYELLRSLSAEKLARLLEENADEPYAEEIAEIIFQHRESITTTIELNKVINDALKSLPAAENDAPNDSVRRVFQALRIAVNNEFSALDTLLNFLPYCLNKGGRVAIITFHSGEDRRVKQAFRNGLASGDYCEIASEVVRPTPQERHSNLRATSAKLRWAVKS